MERYRNGKALLPLLCTWVLTHVACDALVVDSATHRRVSTPLSPSQLDDIILSPHVGYVHDESQSLEIFVIGTSHLRCNSAREVTSLIETVRPDGVVLELDPERVLRLTKESQGFDENGASGGRRNADDIIYGADFAAAVDACQDLDVPLFLGDEYVQETQRRILERALDWRAYSPAPIAKAVLSSLGGEGSERKARIDILGTFAQDPQKLVPIATTISPAFLLATAFALSSDGAVAYDGSALSNAVETIASIIASYLASSLLFNTVIAERDEILAASTLRASKVLRSLKDGASIRKRWRFTVNQEKAPLATGTNGKSDSLPLFTLKTPLKKAAIRNLNLFEPRWLKMIDRITKEKGAPKANTFGCVRCTNKFYSAVSIGGVEGRYADIIFERVGTFARIKELREGRRPVSGDRKVNLVIEGRDSFVVDESNLSMSDDGYMVVTDKILPVEDANIDRELSSRGDSKGFVRMVVVVGLLHGNGVVDLLSKS